LLCGIHVRRLLRRVLSVAPILFPFSVMARGGGPQFCGPGVTLKLSAPSSSQGSLLLLQVLGSKPLAEVTAEWNSKNIPFWRVPSNVTDPLNIVADLREAILGVDLGKAPGTYPLVVHVQTTGGKPDA